MSPSVLALRLRASVTPPRALFLLIALFLALGPSSLTQPSRAYAATVLGTTTYASNTTWTLAGSPYVLNGNVTIAASAILTIEPGVVVKLNGTLREIRVNGALVAEGTAANRIVITSYQDDTVGGDSNGDGSATSGAVGQWYRIKVNSQNALTRLAFVDVRYGGATITDNSAGVVDLPGDCASVTIEDSTIVDNRSPAVHAIASSSGASCYPGVSIARTALQRNGAGVVLLNAWATVTTSTITGNSRSGLHVNFGLTYAGTPTVVTDSELSGNNYGVYLLIDSGLAAAYWPQGSRNNISENATGQLWSFGTKRVANWERNFWGSDVYHYSNAAACHATGQNSLGKLAYQSSQATPPAGPISSGGYAAGSTSCAYDKVEVRPCEFSDAPVAGTNGDLHISFDDPVPVSEAVDCAEDSGFHTVELESGFDSLSGDLATSYMPESGMTQSEIIDEYGPMIASLFDEMSALGDYSYTYPGSAPIQRMTVGTNDATPTSTPVPASVCSDPWWPVEGRILTGLTTSQQHSGQRRVYQTFKWDAANLLYFKACRGNLTVEPDAVYDRSDGLTYLGTKVAKISNLPRKYDDTRRFDGDDETSYTVGSGDAQQLVAGRTYFTLIRTKPGNSSTDRAFVRFQNGVRLPNFCYSTHCVFPAIGSDEVVVPKWQHTVPGTTSWTH